MQYSFVRPHIRKSPSLFSISCTFKRAAAIASIERHQNDDAPIIAAGGGAAEFEG
jgi:hypothetical protein